LCLPTDDGGEGLLLLGVAVLDLVAEPDEELEVRPDRVLVVGPPPADALGELRPLRLTVDLLEQPRVVPAPVPVVDLVPGELGMEEVEPGEVHVDDEALKGTDLCRIVVQSNGQ